MNKQEQKYVYLWKETPRMQSSYPCPDFVQFCIEWDVACKRIKNAKKRRRAKK